MTITRRSIVGGALGTTLAGQKKKLPVGLEMFSVRSELAKDLHGTVAAVAKMGYECVEFFSPYTQWTPEKAREVRKQMDDLGIRCLSTHNGANMFAAENVDRAIELNTILGSRYIVMASAGRVEGLDGWKRVAETLQNAVGKMNPAGIRPGFHNHRSEFEAIGGKMPMEVLAEGTSKDVTLQFDVGTCVHAGVDPVAWILKNPGRITSMHCKDWSKNPELGYKALFGEGDAPWKAIFAAAEKAGGLEFYLVEQEGSRYPALETAEKCLAKFRELHG
jgi:sugar phosphate isomerase/epimerase